MMILRVFIILVIAGLSLTACKNDKHYSFTESELEWILYNTVDSPRYLMNKTDTVTTSVTSWVMENDNCYHEGMPNHYDEYYEEGYFDLYIGNPINISSAVRIYCYRGFSAQIDIPGRSFDSVIPKELTDTTLVNGVIYHGVHKYYVNTPDGNDAAYFCFVPGKGYVQIILNNGTLIELISE